MSGLLSVACAILNSPWCNLTGGVPIFVSSFTLYITLAKCCLSVYLLLVMIDVIHMEVMDAFKNCTVSFHKIKTDRMTESFRAFSSNMVKYIIYNYKYNWFILNETFIYLWFIYNWQCNGLQNKVWHHIPIKLSSVFDHLFEYSNTLLVRLKSKHNLTDKNAIFGASMPHKLHLPSFTRP